MNIYLRTLVLCFLSLLNTPSYSQTSRKLRIDLDRAYGGVFSNYLDNIEYIPLENTKDSEFGQISNLILTDSSFVITDRDTRSVLFFSTSGKFLRKISKKGTLSATGALYDAKKNTINIAFQDIQKSKVLFETYSLAGSFIAKSNIDNMNKNFIHNTIVIDENNFWIRCKFSKIDTINAFYFSQYKNNVKVKSVIPFDSLNAFGLYHLTRELGYSILPTIHSNNFYFSTPLEHKIYKVNTLNGTAEPLFQIIFPAKFGIKSALLAVQDKKKWIAFYILNGLMTRLCWA